MTAAASSGTIRSRSSAKSGGLVVVGRETSPTAPAVAGTVVGVAGVFAIAALFGLAVCHTMLAQGEYRLAETTERIAVESERNNELSATVAGLESPARIEAEAGGRLGMVRPDDVRWLVELDPHADLSAGDIRPFRTESEAPTP